MNRLFCFGLGYSALALAQILRAQGFAIAGTCRKAAQAEVLREAGVDAYVFSGIAPMADFDAAFEGTTHLLLSVPPDEAGDPVFRCHAADLSRHAARLSWAGYFSTTGVYGDHGGAWVDEETPLAPVTMRGQRRLAAERDWARLELPLHIFRLPGIYGPGRNQLRSVVDGTARRIVKPGQVFSRIHVEDIAAVLAASIERPHSGTAYNVCDDEPCPPQEVVEFAARLLNMPPPPETAFEAAALSPMARSFYAESKRVSNRRIRQALGVALRYPTYREGLRALYDSGTY